MPGMGERRDGFREVGNRVRLRVFAILACALVAAACSTPPRLEPGPHLTVVSATGLPPPDGVDVSTGERVYRVGPSTRFPSSCLASMISAGPCSSTPAADSVPPIGTIEASGKTPTELATEIATRLRGRYMRDPQVTVNLEETVSQVVTVDGQVREPGLYPVVGHMTLMRAIATAKGASEFAGFRTLSSSAASAAATWPRCTILPQSVGAPTRTPKSSAMTWSSWGIGGPPPVP